MTNTVDFGRSGNLIDRLKEVQDEVVAMRMEDPTETPEYKEMLVVVKKLGKALSTISGQSTVS